MTEPPIMNIDDPDDTPMEVDCPDCGTHHVVDPVKVRTFLDKRHFWCTCCHRRRRTDLLVGIELSHENLKGFCLFCERQGKTPA